jgi:hypothetical protein
MLLIFERDQYSCQVAETPAAQSDDRGAHLRTDTALWARLAKNAKLHVA